MKAGEEESILITNPNTYFADTHSRTERKQAVAAWQKWYVSSSKSGVSI